ncbi:hypothetical protein BD560DRAFT_84122 [Blakeslea trispora]|nr:hypothetical protein BD560DRAFT_84122 [Blakeslea trispora]
MIPTIHSALLIPRRLGSMIIENQDLLLYHVLCKDGHFHIVLITPTLLDRTLPQFNQSTEGAQVHLQGSLNQYAFFVNDMKVLNPQVPISDRVWLPQAEAQRRWIEWSRSEQLPIVLRSPSLEPSEEPLVYYQTIADSPSTTDSQATPIVITITIQTHCSIVIKGNHCQ